MPMMRQASGLVEASLPGRAALISQPDIRMLEVRRDADLAQEPLNTKDRTQLGIEHFHRHSAIMTEVPGEVDRRHAPTAKLTLDFVPASQGSVEGSRRIHAQTYGSPLRSAKAVRRRRSLPPGGWTRRPILLRQAGLRRPKCGHEMSAPEPAAISTAVPMS